jgi:translation initiation factor 2 subunit 2
MVDPYETLLNKAYANVTVQSESTERFIVPEAKSYIEGKTTVLENFSEIADIIRRDQDHLMKYLLGELGTAGKIDGKTVFNSNNRFAARWKISIDKTAAQQTQRFLFFF